MARRLLTAAALALYLLLAWTPVAALLVSPLIQTAKGAGMLAWLSPGGRRWGILFESLGYAAVVALLATAVGSAAALYCWRRRGGLADTCRLAALLSAVIPPYLHALAWMPLLAALPQHGSGVLTGWISSVWVQSLAMLPFCFAIAAVALEGLDAKGIEAARVFAGDVRLVVRVILPLLRPALLASAALAFLLTIADHAVPSLFSRSTYAMEIFEEFSATQDSARTLMIALPLVAVSLLALLPLGWFWRAASQRPPARAHLSPLLALPPLRAAAAIVLLPLLALMASMGRELLHPAAWEQPLAGAAGDLLTSAAVSVSSAIVAMALSLGLARALARHQAALWWLAAIPLAMPPALVGVGLIWIWNRRLPVDLYGGFAMLPLAALARFAPLALLVAAAWRSRLDNSLLEAAQLFGGECRALLKVEIPLMSPGLLAAAAMVFALTLGELGASLLVAPPGTETLAMRIYNYLHYGASGSVAVLALCMMAANAAVTLAVVQWWKAKR